MYNFMFFRYEGMSDDEKNNYYGIIKDVASNMFEGYIKGKKILVITGSGISRSVPCMDQIMKKIESLIDSYDKNWEKSKTFKQIYEEYRNASKTEKHQMQARLLTYIQNAYLDKIKYVQTVDLEPLKNIWENFVFWLIEGDGNNGLKKATPSEQHKAISDMYSKMRAISITTNFDNLLSKAFDEKKENFYPILDNEAFNRYFTSDENDNSNIEIQSRGDAFWLHCTGSKNKICPNRHKQCFVPNDSITYIGKSIKCNICKSEAKIYFAFPGTKEKDQEMSSVIDGVWKYFANAISSVVIIGNSMDYDPVLIEFLRELKLKRRVPIVYISSYKGSKEYKDIFEKEATRFLFRNSSEKENIWIRADETEKVLYDMLNTFEKIKEKKELKKFEKEDFKDQIINIENNLSVLFTENDGLEIVENNLKLIDENLKKLLRDNQIKRMRHFSQLGMKTYWLRGYVEQYQNHNRYKHSIGVMLIASYIYLKINENKNENLNKNEWMFLQIAAMLHDVGHLPFSHLLEEVFDEFGWIPSGESSTFNHEQHTKHIIDQMIVNGSALKAIMESIDYSKEELQQLINGEYGKGYLDALINSPVDCDKIEYLFSDAYFMGRGSGEDLDIFIKGYVEDLSFNSENFLVLKKKSTISFLNLIKMRGEMYDQVYLRRGLRYLEACCKLIIRTFIAYKCTEKETYTSVESKEDFNDFYNLSETKIKQVIDYMEKNLNDLKENEVCELHVLECMVNAIKDNKIISSEMKETVEKCFERIKNTTEDRAIKEIETDRIVTFEVASSDVNKEALKKLQKEIYLRFPGIILVDYVESKSSFSFGKRENRKRRSDGTRSATENILIKDIKQLKGYPDEEYKCLGDVNKIVNEELHFPNHRYINIYRITENLFKYMQAEDYVIHQLKKEGIING